MPSGRPIDSELSSVLTFSIPLLSPSEPSGSARRSAKTKTVERKNSIRHSTMQEVCLLSRTNLPDRGECRCGTFEKCFESSGSKDAPTTAMRKALEGPRSCPVISMGLTAWRVVFASMPCDTFSGAAATARDDPSVARQTPDPTVREMCAEARLGVPRIPSLHRSRLQQQACAFLRARPAVSRAWRWTGRCRLPRCNPRRD